MSTKPRIALRVEKGVLIPDTKAAVEQLRKMGLQIGDVVMVEVRKSRNPAFHRFAHALGEMLSENIDVFLGMDSHSVIKQIQREARIECEVMTVDLAGEAIAEIVRPKSIAYDSLDETEFRELVKRLCDHVAAKYMGGMQPESVEEMVKMFVC